MALGLLGRRGRLRYRERNRVRALSRNNSPQFERPRLYRIEGKVLMNEGGALPERVRVRWADDGEDVFGDQGWFQLSIGFFDGRRAGRCEFGTTCGGGAQVLGSAAPHTDSMVQARLTSFRADGVRLKLLTDSSVNYLPMVLRPCGSGDGFHVQRDHTERAAGSAQGARKGSRGPA